MNIFHISGSDKFSKGGAVESIPSPHGYHPAELPGGPGGAPLPLRGGHGENTDQYYAEQYDQYYR